MNRVLFANESGGYLWGVHQSYWTTDGGRSWTHDGGLTWSQESFTG